VQGCRCDCSLCPSTSAVCAVAACSLDASVAGFSKLVLPPCFAWCRGASLTAASVLRRRLSAVAGLALDASVAGFYKLVLPSRRAWCRGAGWLQPLCPSTAAVCRRLVRSTQASLACLSWCYHRGVRCRGASLTAASVLGRRLCAVATLAVVASVAGFSKLVRGAGVQVWLQPLSFDAGCMCAVAVLARREHRWLL